MSVVGGISPTERQLAVLARDALDFQVQAFNMSHEYPLLFEALCACATLPLAFTVRAVGVVMYVAVSFSRGHCLALQIGIRMRSVTLVCLTILIS